jgi:hypothetical protein
VLYSSVIFQCKKVMGYSAGAGHQPDILTSIM